MKMKGALNTQTIQLTNAVCQFVLDYTSENSPFSYSLSRIKSSPMPNDSLTVAVPLKLQLQIMLLNRRLS